MKDTFYFQHDYNARSDEKIIKLISKEGWEGYGLYWAIVEKLYEEKGYLEKDYECIDFDLRTQCERIASVIEKYNLFKFKNNKFYSEAILERLAIRKEKSEKARKSANIKWNNANAMRTHSEGNAIKERKGKEIKRNIINNNYKFSFKGNPCYNAGDKDWPKWKVLENGQWKDIASGYEKEIIN